MITAHILRSLEIRDMFKQLGQTCQSHAVNYRSRDNELGDALSPPHHYIAAKGASTFFAYLQVRAVRPPSTWGLNADASLCFDPTSLADQWSDFREQERPYLRAMFCPSRGLIHVEALDKGCLLKGQRFISSTLNQIRFLAPSATKIVLANVIHSQTRQLLLEVLQNGNCNTALDHESNPGPLVKGLLRAGGFDIKPEREAPLSNYLSLTARCKN